VSLLPTLDFIIGPFRLIVFVLGMSIYLELKLELIELELVMSSSCSSLPILGLTLQKTLMLPFDS